MATANLNEPTSASDGNIPYIGAAADDGTGNTLREAINRLNARIRELYGAQNASNVVQTPFVDGDNIKDDTIDSQHYAAGSIDNEHLAANSVDSDQYVDGSIDTAHIADDAIDGTKLAQFTDTLSASTDGHVLIASGGTFSHFAMTGDITINGSGQTSIGSGKVGTSNMVSALLPQQYWVQML